MLELCLFLLFIIIKLKSYLIFLQSKKRVIIYRNINWLCYTPDLIQIKEVEDAVELAQKYSLEAAMLIYTQILSLLKSKTIIQFQMYGLGKIWHKNSNGALQLSVAFKLHNKFKERFPQIIMTSQEPCHFPAEIEYLRSKNVHVFERESFSSNYFLDAASKSNVSEPLMIVYMIHFNYDVFDDFLEAHWDAKLLSQIIFVGNELSEPFPYGPYSRKRIEYSKLCEFKPLEWPQLSDKPNEANSLKAFSDTKIYTISYANAKRLVTLIS